MGTLFLVRHGQASFGAADYDHLSPLGERQCRLLGEHLRARGMRFDAAISGTLRRQVESLDAIVAGLGTAPAPERRPALNEYDAEAVVRARFPEPPPPPDPADPRGAYRHHFRLLREGLAAWMAGHTAPTGMPAHAAFVAGIGAALQQVRERHDGNVLMVSSGGPIATAVGLVLGLAPPAVIELNLRIRNSAVSELAFTRSRHMLLSFNGVPHLEGIAGAKAADWITYA